MKYIIEGESVEFQCNSVPLTLWYYNNQPNVKIFENKLVIERVQRSNHGKYKCKGTNKDHKRFFAMGYLRLMSKNYCSTIFYFSEEYPAMSKEISSLRNVP